MWVTLALCQQKNKKLVSHIPCWLAVRIWEGPSLSSFFQVKKCLFLHLLYRLPSVLVVFCLAQANLKLLFPVSASQAHMCIRPCSYFKKQTKCTKKLCCFVVCVWKFRQHVCHWSCAFLVSLGVRRGCWIPWTGLQMAFVSHHVGGRNQIWILCKDSHWAISPVPHTVPLSDPLCPSLLPLCK